MSSKNLNMNIQKHECVICKDTKSVKHFNLFHCHQCKHAKVCDECSIRASEPDYREGVSKIPFAAILL